MSAPAAGRSLRTSGFPNVRVPVLSSTTVFTWPSCSRYSPPLMMAPARAAPADGAENRQGCAGCDSTGTRHDNDRDGRADVARYQVGEHRGAQSEIDQVAPQAIRQPLYRSA